MVKLAPTLPKELEHNGLEANGRRLLDAYQSQDTIPVVALVRTKEVLSNEDFERIPKVEIVAIEPATLDADDAEARRFLLALHDSRLAHVKQPLDLPDTDVEHATVGALSITAGDVVDAELVDDDTAPAYAEQDA